MESWHRFPRVMHATRYSIGRQLMHVLSEVIEVFRAFLWLKITGGKNHEKLIEETFDLIHSCETLLWIIRLKFGHNMEYYIAGVEAKNRRRGYYLYDPHELRRRAAETGRNL